MADILSILAEARIRDWQRRKDAGELAPVAHDPLEERQSLEGQLLREILDLLERAATASEAERQELHRRASELEIRLMVLLESNGLRLAARRIAAELRAQRGKAERDRRD